MKRTARTFIYLFIGVSFLTLFNELYFATVYYNKLNNNNVGLPSTSHSYELALNSEKYAENAKKGVKKRFATVTTDLFRTCIYFSVGLLFLTQMGKKILHTIVKNPFNLFYKNFCNISFIEVNILTILVGLFTLGMLLEKFMVKMTYFGEMTFYIYILKAVLFITVLIPILISIVFLLLKHFGAKLIFAVYISIFLKSLYEFLEDDTVNLELMTKIDPREFPIEIQKLLQQNNLSDKVYTEKNASKNINAALIGFGSNARIEIYGNFAEFTEKEKNSIFLHEIGHSIDHSLIKKIIVYFLLVYIEMMILLFMYNSLADNFKTDYLSSLGAFISLYLLYLMFIRKWIFMFHRLVSQSAELSADMIAKEYRYNEDLGRALFRIAIDSSDYINPTWFYNALKAMHPSIYTRIEYLLK